MDLGWLDIAIIAVYLIFMLIVGLKYRSTAGQDLASFFLGGRKLPWYVLGVSMVATTFAADTPLLVTELVAKNGVSGNWLWWNLLIGGMLTVFFFAKYWRRAEVLTELEFVELRYSGKAASFLRGAKAIYLGVLLNMVVVAWVNLAMINILQVFFGIDYSTAFLAIGAMTAFALIYTAMSGLMGVAITDFIQFIIAMVGCMILAVLVVQSDAIGGLSGLMDKLEPHQTALFPTVGQVVSDGEQLALGLGAFLTFAMVQWWASWYPGSEPGGGGYVAQRMMSARNERDSVYAVIFFQIAHYCLRPWPWIIVALCASVLYPELPLNESGKGFVYVMKDYLPMGLRGLLLVAFFAAYMSTISTQLNWGSSFLTNDLYARFIKPSQYFEDENKASRHYIAIGRIATIIIGVLGLVATLFLDSMEEAFKFLITCGAGLGAVLILRWYWWRVNSWSELTAMLAPVAFVGGLFIYKSIYVGQLVQSGLAESEALLEASQLWYFDSTGQFLLITASTTVFWLLATFLTKPTDSMTLGNFEEKIRPAGWWPNADNSQIIMLIFSWLLATTMAYCFLFSTGYFLFKNWELAILSLTIGLAAGGGLYFINQKIKLF